MICVRFAAPTAALLLFVGAAIAQELPPASSDPVDFAADIEPLFEQRCLACHGPAMQMSGLRLDRKTEAMKGGHSGPAILPGKSAESRLIHMIAGYRVKAAMPPGGPSLSASEIGTVRAWIDQGAEWPDNDAAEATETTEKSAHWAWQPRDQPTPPAIDSDADIRNPIDRFVLARLAEEGIEPSGSADRRTLARRVSLDLTGLPPTAQETAQFEADQRPGAYGRLVERLLASPHFGEKWATHWLDQVRYADSDGYEKDDPRPRAWRYRHWVIEALNRDLPFDQFTNEQIAGDLLPHPSPEQLTATGFHRNTLKNREGGVNKEQFRFEENVDRVSTMGAVWLGMTIGCAQCHDHKFDPIKQEDYYRFFAFVNSIDEEYVHAPLPGERGAWLQTHEAYRRAREELLCEYGVPDFQPEWEEKVIYHGKNPGLDTAWDVNWDTLAKMSDGGENFILIPAEERTERQADTVTDYFIRFYTQVVSRDRYNQLGWGELRAKLRALEQRYPQMSEARVVRRLAEPRTTHIHVRGQWNREGVEVEAGAPKFLPAIAPSGPGETPTRLDLARWIVSPDNPLTARVIVNRVWQEYFGIGIVATSNDFGTQGDRPSHPKLLDWLAQDFVDSGWSLKHLHRRIVNSATYRQASHARPELDERDPDNRLLARQERLRLPAELIRDSALHVSGLLNVEIGGKSVYPPIPDGVTSLGYAGGFSWPGKRGPDQYRRGLYIHFQRTVPYPFLMTFDGAERSVAECSRERSNTPLQALNLLNDPVFLETAQGLATRVLTEIPSSEFDTRLSYAYELALARPPSNTERSRLAEYYREQMRLLDETEDAAKHWYPAALEGVDRTEAAAWTGVSRLILNLDEFITRE